MFNVAEIISKLFQCFISHVTTAFTVYLTEAFVINGEWLDELCLQYNMN